MRFIVLAILIFISSAVLAQNSNESILEYYTSKAGSACDSRNPIKAGVNFSYELTSYYKSIQDEGQAVLIDSLVQICFYSFGQMDSSKTLVKSSKIDSVDITYPNIFTVDYTYFFYPNDTGGNDLSIGFDTRDLEFQTPIGFAVIDRSRFFYKWLYLYYMAERRDERHSRWYRFSEHEGFIFPDSIWEFKAHRGILSVDYFRIEIGIKNITINR